MSSESEFVATTESLLNKSLPAPLRVRRGAPLFYQLTLDPERLDVHVNLAVPKRGTSAFETDLCVFEVRRDAMEVPRVVLELKTRPTTHDVITYSAKARRHKQIYPYLRYGLVLSGERSVPGRFFTHNESLDFCVATADVSDRALADLFRNLIADEVRASRRLEAVGFGRKPVWLFRTDVKVKPVR